MAEFKFHLRRHDGKSLCLPYSPPISEPLWEETGEKVPLSSIGINYDFNPSRQWPVAISHDGPGHKANWGEDPFDGLAPAAFLHKLHTRLCAKGLASFDGVLAENNALLTAARIRIAAGLAKLTQGVLLTVLLASVTACGKSLPDPVERKNGYARIPIDGLVFVIPEKSWLKGYSRNSTDGSVHGFSLHAVAPKVEPWSPANNEQMYKVPGWGARIDIRVSSNKGRKFLKQTESWIEQSTPGCRFGPSPVHKDPNIRFCENQYQKRFGYLDGDQFRYQLRCDSDRVKANEKFPTDPECRLYFFYRDTLNVDLVFAERYFPFAFDIARKVETQLHQFDQ